MKLKEKRLECELKQEELAARLGISVPLLSNFERYVCLPVTQMLRAICKELQSEVFELYDYNELYVNTKQIHNDVLKAYGKSNPSVYKLTVELPNELREKLTASNLEKCGYYSLKDFIWHCCKRFEKKLNTIQSKEKTTQLTTAKVVSEKSNTIAPLTHQ